MVSLLREFLIQTRNRDGAWPYLPGRQSRLEPTCWAALALGDAQARQTMVSWQQPTGLIVEPANQSVNYAFNGLAALTVATHSPDHTAKLATALIAAKGAILADHPQVRLDSSLQGWPWYDGTFSWVEPTSWCTLALKKLARDASGSAARVNEAERLLIDRACKDGGWNYGNSEVYQKQLPAHVPPTAIAVLAMQNRIQDPKVGAAISVLRQQAPREGSTLALALCWLALTAVQSATDDLTHRLRQRVDVALSLGNICAIAMMAYVLNLADGPAARPEPFVL